MLSPQTGSFGKETGSTSGEDRKWPLSRGVAAEEDCDVASQAMRTRCSCAAQSCGRAAVSWRIVRSAGAVRSAMARRTAGDRQASGRGLWMVRSPMASRAAISSVEIPAAISSANCVASRPDGLEATGAA